MIILGFLVFVLVLWQYMAIHKKSCASLISECRRGERMRRIKRQQETHSEIKKVLSATYWIENIIVICFDKCESFAMQLGIRQIPMCQLCRMIHKKVIHLGFIAIVYALHGLLYFRSIICPNTYFFSVWFSSFYMLCCFIHQK